MVCVKVVKIYTWSFILKAPQIKQNSPLFRCYCKNSDAVSKFKFFWRFNACCRVALLNHATKSFAKLRVGRSINTWPLAYQSFNIIFTLLKVACHFIIFKIPGLCKLCSLWITQVSAFRCQAQEGGSKEVWIASGVARILVRGRP